MRTAGPPRAVVLRVAAVIVVIATAAFVASDLAALHRRAADFGEPRPAVVTRRDLQVGATITRADVTTRTIYSSQLPPGIFDDERAVVGRVVTVPLLRDAFVARGNVAARHRSGLDGAIPAGMRALRIVVTDAVQPRVGAAVDVLASFEDQGFSGLPDADDAESLDEVLEGDDTATIVADGVLVLDVGAASSASGASARGVTLLVTPAQARDLVFAVTRGFVTISLVPPEDSSSPKGRP